jgi:hypothetical protein
MKCADCPDLYFGHDDPRPKDKIREHCCWFKVERAIETSPKNNMISDTGAPEIAPLNRKERRRQRGKKKGKR